jgi:hypothetical protein
MNHEHSVALHFMYYNFCRIHQSLRLTPAMEAGVTDHVWSIGEVINLLWEIRLKKKDNFCHASDKVRCAALTGEE